ncbi:MAG: chromosomal replication initiator DnaA [Pseudomonadota bacterium]
MTSASAQTVLPLKWTAATARVFHVGAPNADAVAGLSDPEAWPDRAALLVGPAASGKSHLADLLAARGIEIIEDADRGRHDDTMLFHALNRARNGGAPLLLTARSRPTGWPVALPDLTSRLLALPRFEIGVPDEAFTGELLASGLARRGFSPAPELIAYMVKRIERSHAAIASAVAVLDEAATTGGRRLTIPLARARLFGEDRA